MTDSATHTYCVVTARDEEACISETLAALRRVLPEATLLLADDGSRDGTARVASAAGARVLSTGRRVGKGAAATRAAREALRAAARECEPGGDEAPGGASAVVLLCDGDLGASAAALAALVRAVEDGEADVAVAAFRERLGGGFGIALGFARWAIERGCGFRAIAPLSGQRALRADALERVLPFAQGFGMELGMTIDLVRAGARVKELELDLAHRATGRTPAGFAHRARQLLEGARAYQARR